MPDPDTTETASAAPPLRGVWLECGAARFEALLCELGTGGCRLLVDACCCARLREGCEVAVELPPPLSAAGLLRLPARIARREAGPAHASHPRESVLLEFGALSSPQLLALGLALPGEPSGGPASVLRAA